MTAVNRILKKQKSYLKDDSGVALVLVLIVMFVLIVLGTAAYNISQSSLKQAVIKKSNLQAEYLARSAVDATKEAWSAEVVKDPTEKLKVNQNNTFYNRYDYTNDNFINDSAANEGNDGIIKTVQNYDASTGICTITSTVKIGSTHATVKAVSEKLSKTNVATVNVDNTNKWYENHAYSRSTIFFGTMSWSSWTILPGPLTPSTISGTTTPYTSSYHSTEGLVYIDTDITNSSTLYANANLSSNSYTVTGLQAKRIQFNCPLDIYTNTSWKNIFGGYSRNPQSLIVSAETIVFNKKLTIGDGAYGNLTLRLPPGHNKDGFAGISGDVIYDLEAKGNESRALADKVNLLLIDKSKTYGLVHFSNVQVNASSDTTKNNPALIANKSFFFRLNDPTYKSLKIGTKAGTFDSGDAGCTFQDLIRDGYLIPATEDDINSSFSIEFTYE